MDHGEIIIYEAGNNKVEVRLDRETVWLTQRQMSKLFETSSDNISLHLKNIYAVRELGKKSTTEDFSAVQKEGKRYVRRTLTHYNLDAIISVGYRVNSKRGVRFRQLSKTGKISLVVLWAFGNFSGSTAFSRVDPFFTHLPRLNPPRLTGSV